VRQRNELDTLRWGDRFPLKFNSLIASNQIATAQLVRSRWRRPVTWQVQVYIDPVQGFNAPAPEAGTFTIRFISTVGVGQATTDIVSTYTLAPVAGVYSPIRDNGLIPAQHLNINAQVTGGSTNPGEHVLYLSAYVAPVTDPSAMAEMYELLARQAQQENREQDVILEDWHLRPDQFR
jgi:hypothetical protein